jgi:Tfp pilus assembly protein PilV
MRSHFVRGRRARGAFTFVEVLAALVFLAVLLPAVMRAYSICTRASAAAERTTIATQLGENRLSELMVNDAWTAAERRGDFGDEWPGYRWELTQGSWEADAMVELTLDIFFQVQGQERGVRLSTLANESTTQ